MDMMNNYILIEFVESYLAYYCSDVLRWVKHPAVGAFYNVVGEVCGIHSWREIHFAYIVHVAAIKPLLTRVFVGHNERDGGVSFRQETLPVVGPTSGAVGFIPWGHTAPVVNFSGHEDLTQGIHTGHNTYQWNEEK